MHALVNVGTLHAGEYTHRRQWAELNPGCLYSVTHLFYFETGSPAEPLRQGLPQLAWLVCAFQGFAC